jgi:hypothetical protein
LSDLGVDPVDAGFDSVFAAGAGLLSLEPVDPLEAGVALELEPLSPDPDVAGALSPPAFGAVPDVRWAF